MPANAVTLDARLASRDDLRYTPAGLPALDFQLAHARARDAVYATLDAERIIAELGEIGFEAIRLRSAATDRLTYLRRPDLGRRLDGSSRQLLEERPRTATEVAFVIADGLSATAVNSHAIALLKTVSQHSAENTRVVIERSLAPVASDRAIWIRQE